MTKAEDGREEEGQTETTNAESQCVFESGSEGLGAIQGKGRASGDKQDETSNSNSERTDCIGGDRTGGRESRIGGILSQLKDLKKLHLAFVDAHTERLKARLADDEQYRSHLVASIESLEEEILEVLGTPGEE